MTPAEAIRHQVREALGPWNDQREDVVALVIRLREDLLAALDEIRRLRDMRTDIAFLERKAGNGTCAG